MSLSSSATGKTRRAVLSQFWAYAALVIVLLLLAACGGETAPVAPPSPAAPVAEASLPTRSPLPTPTSTPAPTNTPEPTPAPTEPPESLSAQEVLEKASAAMAAVESGYAEVEIQTQLAEGPMPVAVDIQIVGDFQAPDRSQFNVTMATGGFTIETEFITVGTESYVKNPFNGEWNASPESPAPFGNLLALGAVNLDFDPEVAGGFTLVGKEQLDGETVYRLQGVLSGDDLAKLLDGPQSALATSQVEYWIGVDDFLLREIRFHIEQAVEGTVDGPIVDAEGAPPLSVFALSMDSGIKLSDYGKQVDIQAPEVSISQFMFPESDDHGDAPDSGTTLEIGVPIEGAVDSEFDRDYFHFHAVAGRTYTIDVTLGTLEGAEVTVFDSQGYGVGWTTDPADPQVVVEGALDGEYDIEVVSSGYPGSTYNVKVIEAGK